MVLNNIEIEETNVDKLLSLLLNTNNILVANMVAFRLKKFKDSRILDALVKVINRSENFNKRAKLIYSCDEYDCTRYFELFLEIVLEEHGESCINAIDIISQMKGPFLHNQLSNAVNKIENYINLNKNNDNVPYLNKLKEHLGMGNKLIKE